MKVSIIVPCYNEEVGINNLEKQLNEVIPKLKKDYKVELIFVDDGSSDNTNKLLNKKFGKQKGVKILKHNKNKNLGAALKTGFKNSTGDLIFCLDSDCTYPPKLIFPMLKLIKDADIVTVSPFHPKGSIKDISRYRIFLSQVVTTIYRLTVSMKIYTYGAMVRLYKRKVIENIKPKSNDFLAVPEIMVKSMLKGYKVKELPTSLRIRAYGTSKMKVMNTILNHLGFIFRIVLYRIFGAKL